MDTFNNNLIVSKSNDLIESGRYHLSLIQEKLLLLVISMIEPGDQSFKRLTYKTQDVINFLELGEETGYNQLKSLVRDLVKKEVYIEHGRNQYTVTTWLAGASTKDKGKIHLEISETLAPYLLQLKKRFTQMQLQYLLKAKSTYTIRFYELLKMKLGMGIVDFVEQIDDLKLRFKIEKKYKLYGDFKRNVLTPAIDEINDKMDLDIDYEEVKEGKKVVGIRFFNLAIKEGFGKILNGELDEDVKNVLRSLKTRTEDVKLMERKGFAYLTIGNADRESLVESYGGIFNLYVKDKIALYERAAQSDKGVKNPAGFLLNAIRNNWQDKVNVVKEKKQLKKVVDEEKKLLLKRLNDQKSILWTEYYQRVSKITQNLYETDPALFEEAMIWCRAQPGYDKNKTVLDNYKNPTIFGFAKRFAEKRRPDLFSELNANYEQEEKDLSRQISELEYQSQLKINI